MMMALLYFPMDKQTYYYTTHYRDILYLLWRDVLIVSQILHFERFHSLFDSFHQVMTLLVVFKKSRPIKFEKSFM